MQEYSSFSRSSFSSASPPSLKLCRYFWRCWVTCSQKSYIATERSRTPFHTVGQGSPFGKLSQEAAWPSLVPHLPSLSSFPSTSTISGRARITIWLTMNGTQLSKNSYRNYSEKREKVPAFLCCTSYSSQVCLTCLLKPLLLNGSCVWCIVEIYQKKSACHACCIYYPKAFI